jgi:hypothetical protein
MWHRLALAAILAATLTGGDPMPALQVPPGAVNYQGQLYPLPSLIRQPGFPGTPPAAKPDSVVPFGITWSTDAGANNAVFVDLKSGQGGVDPINQIIAVYVDNIKSNVDVSMLFLDTQFNLTIPAKSQGLYPVATNQTQFFLSAPGAAAGDVTFFQVFNFMPPPVAIAESFLAANQTLAGGIVLTGGSTTTIIPAGINGIVTAISLDAIGITPGAANGQVAWTLQDDVPGPPHVVIVQSQIFSRTGSNIDNLKLFQLSNLNIPFHNGLQMVIATGGTAPTAGTMYGNIYTH